MRARRVLEVQVAGEKRLIAVEDAARYRDALGVPLPPGLPGAFLQEMPDALLDLIRRFARTHGPFTTPETAGRFDLPLESIEGGVATVGAEREGCGGWFSSRGHSSGVV